MGIDGSALFENRVLRSVAEAILRRRKALSKAGGRAFDLERSVDRTEGIAFERLDFSLAPRSKESFRFTLWEDSTARVWRRCLGKKAGRASTSEYAADLWQVEPAAIVRAIEAAIAGDVEAIVRLAAPGRR